MQQYDQRNSYKNKPFESLDESEKKKFSATRTNRKSIGAQLAALRVEAGYTADEVSEITGVPRSHILRAEGGRYNVCLDDLALLADLYGCKVELRKKL